MRDTMAESGNEPHLPAKEQGNPFCKLQHCGARANARLYHDGSPECARRFQSVPGGVTMQYTAAYQSSVGDVLLAADETGLTGLWFEGEKFYALSLDPEHAFSR